VFRLVGDDPGHGLFPVHLHRLLELTVGGAGHVPHVVAADLPRRVRQTVRVPGAPGIRVASRSKAWVSMTVSDRSTRCTGQRSAMDIGACRCSAVSGPSRRSCRIRVSVPVRMDRSAQPFAWMRSCRSRTETCCSGQPFWSAYIRRVMDVQAPSAARSWSYGLGPASPPPTETGSSTTQSWGAGPYRLPVAAAAGPGHVDRPGRDRVGGHWVDHGGG